MYFVETVLGSSVGGSQYTAVFFYVII